MIAMRYAVCPSCVPSWFERYRQAWDAGLFSRQPHRARYNCHSFALKLYPGRTVWKSSSAPECKGFSWKTLQSAILNSINPLSIMTFQRSLESCFIPPACRPYGMVILVRRPIDSLIGWLLPIANSGRCFRLGLRDMATRRINVLCFCGNPYLISRIYCSKTDY